MAKVDGLGTEVGLIAKQVDMALMHHNGRLLQVGVSAVCLQSALKSVQLHCQCVLGAFAPPMCRGSRSLATNDRTSSIDGHKCGLSLDDGEIKGVRQNGHGCE